MNWSKYVNTQILFILFTAYAQITFAQQYIADSDHFNQEASQALLKRVIPNHARHFKIEYIQKEAEKDVFELESVGDKIVLRGNNGVSVASALNYYLKYYAYCEISWNGINLNIPSPMPKVEAKVRKMTPYKYRHYFNYCTFNYTASWWDWDRWQWETGHPLNKLNIICLTFFHALIHFYFSLSPL